MYYIIIQLRIIMTEEEKQKRQNRSVGRPKQDLSKKRYKKLTLSLTQDEYAYLEKMQKALNRPTITSTILYFMERGQEAVREDFSQER